MKSLLKKGEKSDKGATPKKSLFGKKPVKKVADDIDEPVAPKKTGFSLTKKRTANADDAVEQGGKKTKPAKKSAKGGGMDTKKLVPILGGFLALILLALAAKMFLFSEPEPEPVVPKIPPPSAQPKPQPAQPVAPAGQPSQPNSGQAQAPQPVAPTAQPPAQPASPEQAQPNQPVQVAPAQPTDMTAPTTQAPQTRQFTREEFLQESKNKVYRERETTQPQPAAPSQ